MVVLRGVTVRPASDREEEFAAACREDRRKLSTPFPRPTSGTPPRFWVEQGPKLPTPPPRRMPINPVVPDNGRTIQAAAVSARALQEQRKASQEREEWLLAEADKHAARPRTPSPPRDPEDWFDLAKWNQQRWM